MNPVSCSSIPPCPYAPQRKQSLRLRALVANKKNILRLRVSAVKQKIAKQSLRAFVAKTKDRFHSLPFSVSAVKKQKKAKPFPSFLLLFSLFPLPAKRNFFTFFSFITFSLLFSAPPLQAQPLTINNHFDLPALPNILNKPQSFNTSNKLLILDFMATSCVSCIRRLPLMDSLQKQFPQIQIILVSPEKPERIKAFLKKNPGMQLPFVYGDTTLIKSFPHEYISHVAWIDESGTVRAITHAEYVTASNIQKILSGTAIHWPVKKDDLQYDVTKPLLTPNENNIPESALPATASYTAVLNYLPGLPKYNKIIIDSFNHSSRLIYINYSITDLLLMLQDRFGLPPSQIFVPDNDRSRFFYDSTAGYFEEWKMQNYFCLESVSTLSIAEQKQQLLSSLCDQLRINAVVEKRLTNCLVLRNKKDTLGSVDHNHSSSLNHSNQILRIGKLTYLLNRIPHHLPVIDETTETLNKQNTSFTLLPITEHDLTNEAQLQNILSNYNLELIPAQREIECLIITNEPETRNPSPATRNP